MDLKSDSKYEPDTQPASRKEISKPPSDDEPVRLLKPNDGECKETAAVDHSSPRQLRSPTNDIMGSSNVNDALNAIALMHEREGEVDLSSFDTVVLVAFELPVKVIRKSSCTNAETATADDFEVVPTNSLVLPGLLKICEKFTFRMKFVGFPGYLAKDENEKDIIADLLEEYHCYPVFPNGEDLKAFLNFCHGYLWPLFHNCIFLGSHSSQPPFESSSWAVYQMMNKLWATSAVMQCSGNDSDLIWVHDYQLMLVPHYIVRKNLSANIGFFLHIPFPSSEVFRCLPVREEVLRSLLCADLVGFHFFEYARHFLVANKRLLGIDHHFRLGGFLGLEYNGRNVMVKIGHVNIEFEHLRNEISQNSKIVELAKAIRNANPGRYLCVSVDRCEELSGLVMKLKGVQEFLNTYSYARGKVKLIQYVYPTHRGYGQNTDQLKTALVELAKQINCAYERGNTDKYNSHQYGYNHDSSAKVSEDVIYDHVELHFEPIAGLQKYALFQAGDCLFDSSIRDGLNLNAFEYICCRGDAPCCLILSEFTGCSRALASAFRVNPWKVDSMSAALDRVMTTPAEELRDRSTRDRVYLANHSLHLWASDFLTDLKRSRKREDKVYMQWGFASTFRVLSLADNFVHLNLRSVTSAYRTAKVRAFFFDHEGTLAPDRRHITTVPGSEALTAQGNAPSAVVKDCLRALSQDPNNVVVILSGRDKTLLDEWFGEVEGIGLCAEHGFYEKVPGITSQEWQCMSPDEDFTWKRIAIELMRLYTKRTQGSFIENKGSALVFQYRDADPEFGTWQAKELATYLEEFMFSYPVTVMSGKGYVEVKLSGVSKGQAVEYITKQMASIYGNVDFILCVGDDRSDEDMFSVVNQMQQTSVAARKDSGGGRGVSLERVLSSGDSSSFKRDSSFLKQKHEASASSANFAGLGSHEFSTARQGSSRMLGRSLHNTSFFSVTVGKKPTHAEYFLYDTDEVSEMLEALRTTAEKMSDASNEAAGPTSSLNNSVSCSPTTPSGVPNRNAYAQAYMSIYPLIPAPADERMGMHQTEDLCNTTSPSPDLHKNGNSRSVTEFLGSL